MRNGRGRTPGLAAALQREPGRRGRTLCREAEPAYRRAVLLGGKSSAGSDLSLQ